MSTHDEYLTRRQARDLARRLARLERRQRSTAAAHADLRHSAIDGGKGLVLKDEQGQEKYRLGTDENGVTAPQYKGGPTPAQPSEPFVDVGGEVVKIQHSGLDVHEAPAPADFRRAQIHVSQDEVFEPSLSSLAGYLEEVDGSFTHRLPGGEWWVGIVWETLSGKMSVMSATVLADIPPLVDAQDIQDTLDAAQERLDEYRDNVAAPRFQALEEGLSESNDSLDDARTRLSAAEQTLSPLPGRIESAEQDVATAQEEATKAAAAAVEANNRAMTRLANGNFESDLLYWDHDNVELTSTAHSGQQAAQVSGWLRPGSSFPVVPDQIWELSLYYQYDVTVEFQAVDGDQRATLSTHHLDGDSAWSDSGTLRVTIPADVHMLSFTITGTAAIVDDITLRDVTDVVRLEEAANANRQKAEQAISELAVLQLAVDGDGGLKDRLASAETTLERKADEAVVDNVAAGLAGLSGLNTRTYIQDDEPPAPSGAVTYEWEGTPHASPSVKKIDGEVVARNLMPSPRIVDSSYTQSNVQIEHDDQELSNLIITTGGGTSYVGITGLPVEPGQWFATALSYEWGEGVGRVRHQIQFRGPNNESIEAPQIQRDRSNNPDGGRSIFWAQVPAGVVEARWYSWFYLEGLFTPAPSGSTVRVGKYSASVSDSEQDAISQVAEAFDGDTPDQPAETGLWLRGEDKFWFDHTTKQWVQVTDTGAFARLISDELFANLAVVDRLQAREGWIGGTLLKDGSVTAEKIHATREMVTKIMGAEWAYIAQQLIVDGKILTRDLEALSAAIQSLTVTQRADIAELWAEELWTALAVIEELQAEEAWITSAMISELTAEKVTVTQNFVGRVAELLHLVVDRIDVNALWADQTWQAAGHFGSEVADFRTRVNGTGITTEHNNSEGYNPVSQLGGPDQALTFWDDELNPTATIERTGDAAFQMVESDVFTHQGRPVFGANPFPDYDGPILDALPKGIRDKAFASMAGVTVGNRAAYGFLEVSARVEAGREYRVRHDPFLMADNTAYYGEYRYTFSEAGPPSAPHTESDRLGSRWRIRKEVLAAQGSGEHVFTAPGTGVIRILLVVGRSYSVGEIRFHNSTLYTGVTLTLEDMGPSRRWTGMRRYAAHGGEQPDRDNQPLVQGYSTAWTPTWQRVYQGGINREGTPYTHTTASIIQGTYNNSWYASHIGGYQTNQAVRGDHAGQTIGQALNGRRIVSGRILLHGTNQSQSGLTKLYWHAYGSAPTSMVMGNPPPNWVENLTTRAGSTRAWNLPQEALDAIQAGTFQGFTIHPLSPDGERDYRRYHGIGGVTHDHPATIELIYEDQE